MSPVLRRQVQPRPRPDTPCLPSLYSPMAPRWDLSTGGHGSAIQGLPGGTGGPPSWMLGTVTGEAQGGGIREGFLEEAMLDLNHMPSVANLWVFQVERSV